MAIKSEMSYHITCDECGDPVIDNEGLTYCHFTTQGAVDYAVDSDWLITDGGHWCPDCRGKHEEDDGE